MNHNFRLKNIVSILILLLCVMISISAVYAEDITNDSNIKSDNSQDNFDLSSNSNSGHDSDSALNSVSEVDSVSSSASDNEKSEVSIIESTEDNSALKNSGDKIYIYIGSDKRSTDSVKFMDDIKAEIGNRATVVIDSNLPDSNGLNNVVKDADKGVAVYISDFFSAGSVYNLVQSNLNNYDSKLSGLCFVYYGAIPVESTNFIARAWDDNYSDERFAGLYSPYKYMTEAGLGFVQAKGVGDVKTVAEGILNYAKNIKQNQLKCDRTSLFLSYVATHDFSPVELANDANKLLNGKSTKRNLQDWIYYAAEYVGALPIKVSTKTFSLPATFSDSSFTGSLSRVTYRDLALKIKEYMDKNGVAPTYITYNNKKININDYCYMLAKIISSHTDKSKFIFASSFTVVKSPVNIVVNKKKFTLKEIIAASKSLKKYITKYKKLPASIKIAGIKLTLSEYLYLAATATKNLNKKVSSAIKYKKFSKKVKVTKNRIRGTFKKSKYLSLANKIIKYMNKKGFAPRTMHVSLGTMQFRTMVYNYACILSFYKSKKSLPKSVYLYDKKIFK